MKKIAVIGSPTVGSLCTTKIGNSAELEVVIINELQSEPLGQIIKQQQSFEITNIRLAEPYFSPKKKHLPKGHERDYRFHNLKLIIHL